MRQGHLSGFAWLNTHLSTLEAYIDRSCEGLPRILLRTVPRLCRESLGAEDTETKLGTEG